MENVPYDKRQGKIWYNGKNIDWKDGFYRDDIGDKAIKS